MNESLLNGRLAWLGAALVAQRNNIAEMIARIKGLVVHVTNVALHPKFLNLMEQISADKEKERDILHEIEAVEKRHDQMRRQKRLRSLDSGEPLKTASAAFEPIEEEQPKRDGILTLFGLIYLFSSKNKPRTLENTK